MIVDLNRTKYQHLLCLILTIENSFKNQRKNKPSLLNFYKRCRYHYHVCIFKLGDGGGGGGFDKKLSEIL